jgi:DNA-binding NtrC family response regulator
LAMKAPESDLDGCDVLWSTAGLSTQQVIFASQSMLQILKMITRIAPTSLSVLITGETGTGKEIIAKAIHDRSDRASGPFIPFNCAAVPRELLESQLFGYRRGAFSGASEQFQGVIRAASNGTLLLDEVGEIPMEMQPKLLRFLESSEIHPLGEARPVKVDVRLLFATNANLEEAIKQQRFREDLFFRMNVIPIKIPPLRERREEIPLLANLFAHRFSRELSKETAKFAADTMERLILYSWPGNVRQLGNEIRRMVAMVDDGDIMHTQLLSTEISGSTRSVEAPSPKAAQIAIPLAQSMAQAVDRLERSMVEFALGQSGGQVTAAAKLLGLSRKGLYLKRQRLGLRVAENESGRRNVFQV